MPEVIRWTGREATILRHAMRLSVRRFADHLGISARTVSEWSSRGSDIVPTPDMQAVLDTTLARRADRAAAARFRHAVADPDPPLNRESSVPWTRPVTHLTDGPMAEQLFAPIVAHLRLLDDELGSGHVVDAAAAHLLSVERLLAETTDPPDRPGLLRTHAELSQLSGWLHFDLDSPGRAWKHLESARASAANAGDDLFAMYALGWQSIVAGERNPELGLTSALAMQHATASDAPVSMRAWAARVLAEASAGVGDAGATSRALDVLENEAERPRSERDPPWTYFIDHGQIAAYRGVCMVRLGRWQEAIMTLETALTLLGPTFVRDRSLYLSYLAKARFHNRDVEAGAVLSQEALALARRTDRSARWDA